MFNISYRIINVFILNYNVQDLEKLHIYRLQQV